MQWSVTLSPHKSILKAFSCQNPLQPVGEEEYEMNMNDLWHWSSKNLKETLIFSCIFALHVISTTSLSILETLTALTVKAFKLICFFYCLQIVQRF